ncbi:MAG: metallophosphoesterase family protein [Bacilli bacterium]|nr:metallophosphoesterase family protein [Bacilli bacterium]
MDEKKNIEVEFVNKVYKYIRNGMSIETFMEKFHVSEIELYGIIELCRMYGKDVSLEKEKDTLVFRKSIKRKSPVSKLEFDSPKLNSNQICVISDTHFGSIHNQLHLVNEIYEEAYNRGIKTVLHVGDLVDGSYPNRPESPRQQFLHGFDQQASYVVDMYPEIEGITTYYILGSHDETHYKNGQATVNNWISRCREDMIYLGQDTGEINIDKVKIVLDHPGGGSAQSLSYRPQKRIEILESHTKPKILLIGHYHKSYAFSYRNVQCILVPALCDKTQFQQKKGLYNALGAYFLNIYSDSKGNIQYFEPEEIIFGKKDIWDETGKDRSKVKKLVMKNTVY